MPVTKKTALSQALTACVRECYRRETRRFLQGLAKDELQYIAEFLGSCILESAGYCHCTRSQLAEAIKQFDRTRHVSCCSASTRSSNPAQDQEHKMILLLEYLCRSGLTQFTIGVGAGQG